MIAADTQEQAAERKRLEYVFNSLQAVGNNLRSLEVQLENAKYHCLQNKPENQTKPGNYPSWEAMVEDLTLSIQDIRKELGPALRDVAQRLYGLNPNV